MLGHKLVEFLLVFVGLKLLTNLMTREAFGEFNLALTAVGLLSDTLVMPIAHAYYRGLSHGTAAGGGASYGVSFLRWYAWLTVGVTVALGAATASLAGTLAIGTWTALGTGLVLLANRWRALAVELLDMRRDRRGSTLQNLGFIVLQTALVAWAAWVSPTSAAAALGAYAAASAVLAVTGTVPLLRGIAEPGQRQGPLWPMIRTFGIPYGALLALQWLQNFSERYILGIRLDLDAVGSYVAAYQVCGVPYMLLSTVLNGLTVPIAYQRAGDATDAVRLRKADRVLLGSLAIYILLGLAALPAFALFGQQLVRMLTSASFVLPVPVLMGLAGARFFQCLALVLQPFFAVHQQMGASLLFRLLGGMIVIPVSWFAIGAYGMTGAGLGSLAAGLIYCVLLLVGPGGCVSMIRRTHRQARVSP